LQGFNICSIVVYCNSNIIYGVIYLQEQERNNGKNKKHTLSGRWARRGREEEGGEGGGGGVAEGGRGGRDGGGGRKKNSMETAAALSFLDKYKLIRSSNAYTHSRTCKHLCSTSKIQLLHDAKPKLKKEQVHKH